MSKKRNLFAGLICLILAFVCLVACDGVTQSPETAAKQKAEADAQEVLGKLIWDDEDRTKITGSLFFATQNKNYPGVSISWTSSEEDIISNEGKVNRPEFDDERNVLDGEDLYATVIITATVVCEYSWEANGTQTATTEPISKQFTFTVLAKPEGTDTGTIEDVKARAWNYIYVEQGVDKALITNSNVTYNVLLSGVVTAKLTAEGATKGFMLHDGTDGIYVYGDNKNVEIGDYVEVIGGVYSYYGSLQVGSNVSVSKSNGKVTLPEYKVVTPQEWEDQNKGLGDDVIGHLGGDLYKVEGYLGYEYNSTTKDEFFITDAYTGEVAWIYYKSYTAEMKAQLEALVGEYVQVAGCGYDRDSRIVKNHLLWNGEVEKVEAPVVDDETKANVALTQITLKDTYDADFDLSDAGTWEIVSGTGVEIVEGVAKVTRADEDQVVVLKVTVTVGEAVVSKELTVTIKAIVKETPKHAGTKEDPYTVSDAVLVAGGLDADVPTEQVYAVGTIKEITDLSLSYGNATFVITDGVKDIIVFRAKYLNNEKFTAEDQIKVGDVVVIVGQLVNYKGNTLEFNSGCYIDSFVEEELPTLGDGTKENPYTVEQALEICAALADKELTEQVYVIGTISSIKEVSASYGNATFNIGDLVVFRAKYLNNEKFTSEDQIKVGDVVVIVGQLTNWGGTLEFNSGCYIDSFVDGQTPEPPVHEHVFVEGKCECGEVDPDYVAPEQPVAGEKVELNPEVLGLDAYADGSKTVDGVQFDFIELGSYGNGIQWRNKTKASSLWNVTALAKPIAKIELVYNAAQANYSNANALKIQFGTDSSVAGYETYLSTTKGTTLYTITPDAETYTYVKFTINITYSMYFDSITIYYVDGDVVTPEPPVHEHVFVEGKCECGEVDPNYVAPEVPATTNKADLDTLNGGKHSSSYADYTSTNGWTVTGCAINSGSADSSATANPSFGCLGGADVRAVTLNGGTDKTLGTVKSGVLSGGLSKLSFNYTNLFSDTKFSVTVYIKDAQGNVLKEEVVSYDNPNKVKYEVRTYELEFAVEGDFIIEIVNNRPNNLTGNKDRATIWNIEWVSAN